MVKGEREGINTDFLKRYLFVTHQSSCSLYEIFTSLLMKDNGITR